MSKMFAEVSRIVDEDISVRVTQFSVLFEAITNAVHANAGNIICVLQSSDSPILQTEDAVEKKVDAIIVSDDGDGLNTDNFNSFCKYRSKHKQDLGCKGVGRFVFLKVYEQVKFKSRLMKEQEERTLTFDSSFDSDDLKIAKANVSSNLTELRFQTLRPQYKDYDKKIDRRIPLDLELIRRQVLLNLLPTLFFYKKKKGRSITITFEEGGTDNKQQITTADVPDFKDSKFEVRNRLGHVFEFTLNYRIEEDEGALNAYYCGNSRTVCEFSDKEFKLSLPYGYSGFLLLESGYLDNHVNNERNDFDIMPVRTDIYSSLSWEMINTALKANIFQIIKTGIPQTEAINREKLIQIQEERPYLVGYIQDEDIEIAGFMDKRDIIDKAKKRFDTAKEKLLAHTGKTEFTNEELSEAIEITQNELVSYVNDRAKVLERLKGLVDKKERVESIIHNLFMERYTTDDYYSIGKNNLWLLDDRFTTYSYAASDKRIKDVLKDIGESSEDIENANEKPDLSLFFSHNPNDPNQLKSVLIEIKPFDFAKKPDKQKHAGIQQLIDYVVAFKKKERIEEIYAFLITDIDDKLATRLLRDSYKPLYSSSAPIYHRFYETDAISIYVVSAKTLIADAEARNKVFLDIIKKQSRLNKIIFGETPKPNSIHG